MKSPIFDYDDTVCVKPGTPVQMRPGEPASVVSITPLENRSGDYLKKFPEGFVYGIEFEGGDIIEVEEAFLQKSKFPGEK